MAFHQVITHFRRGKELSASKIWNVPPICYRIGKIYAEMYVPWKAEREDFHWYFPGGTRCFLVHGVCSESKSGCQGGN